MLDSLLSILFVKKIYICYNKKRYGKGGSIMGDRPPRTTLPTRYKRAQNVVENVRKSDLLKLNSYRLLPLDARFEKLMRLYDSISDWKKEYKKVEMRKPSEVRTPLNVENIEDVIDGAMYDDILELAISMHVANKIAHECDWAIEDIIENFLSKKVKSNELPETVLEDKNATPIIRKIGRIFDPINQGNRKTMEWLRNTLGEYGITSRMLKDLQGCGLEELNKMQRNAFYIKDYEMENAIDLLKDRDDISYGRFSTKGSEGKEHILVIDLPYYGQFCVHMKTERSISALKNTKYDQMHMYETESVLLMDGISRAAKSFIKKRKESGKSTLDQIIPELRKIRKDRPRYAHYIALKMGATKQELDKLYKGENAGKPPRRKPDQSER